MPFSEAQQANLLDFSTLFVSEKAPSRVAVDSTFKVRTQTWTRFQSETYCIQGGRENHYAKEPANASDDIAWILLRNISINTDESHNNGKKTLRPVGEATVDITFYCNAVLQF